MQAANVNDKSNQKISIATRAKTIHFLFHVIVIVILLIIGHTISNSVADDFARRLARQYSIEAAASFQTSTNEHFVLMQQIARSTTVSRWLANQFDEEVHELALREIQGYADFAPEIRLMFTFYESRMRFDFFAAGLDEQDVSPWGYLEGGAVSQWFYNTRDAELPFMINVQRERPSLVEGEIVLFVWSNHRMYYQGQFVGVVTVGSPFESVFEAIFGEFDSTYKRGYIIDENGRVRIDSSFQLVVAELGLPTLPELPEAQQCAALQSGIDAHLGKLVNGVFANRHYTLDAIRLSSNVDVYRYASIAPIIGTNWSVVVLSNQTDVFVGRYIPMIVIAMLLIILSFFGSDIAVRKIALDPLQKLSKSVADAGTEDIEIYGTERNDEIGDVARTIEDMKATLKKAAEEVKRIEVAEESSKAKGLFLARMSHELRTPLAAVLSISEIRLQDTDLTPDMKESFAKIHDSAEFLISLIDDLLDLSKVESGKMTLRNEEYSVADMLRDVANLHLTYLDDKQIKFYLHVDENLPTHLIGDKVRIVQIINNLVSNAFKYTESGSVIITADCEAVDAETIKLKLSVKDTGFGIPSEKLNSLREEYTRFHEQQNRFISGTGLGMSIVYNLAEMMGADLTLTSKVDVGTTVSVSIPQIRAGEELLGKTNAIRLERFEVKQSADAKKFGFTPVKMPYGRVLIVDDMQLNLDIAKSMMEFYDLNIDVCISASQAIDKISQGETYDIIFMDYMMPEISGKEALATLRGMGYEGTIIALTANAIIGQAEEFIGLGFDEFMPKPIQSEVLNTMLMKYIKDKQATS